MNYLFNTTASSNDNKAYYLDTYLYNYTDTDTTTFNNNLAINDYFVKLSGASLAYEDVQDVDLLAATVNQSNVPRTFYNRTSNQTVTLGDCKSYSVNVLVSRSNNGTVYAGPSYFNGDIEMFDINVTLASSIASIDVANIKSNIAYEIDKRVSTLGSSLTVKENYRAWAGSNTLVFGHASHEEFNEYLYEINTTNAGVYLKDAYTIIAETEKETPIVSGWTAEQVQSARQGDMIRLSALANLKVLHVPWKRDPLVKALCDASKKTLKDIVTKYSNSTVLDFDNARRLIQAFRSRTDLTSTTYRTYYYLYRSLMIDKFVIDKSIVYETDSKIEMFMRKLLVDLYIKCCYPLIHYDLITMLQDRYTAIGDFVNARLAILAKCIFTYNMVRAVISNIPEAPVSLSTEFLSNVVAYIGKMNRGESASMDDNLLKIIKDLHTMSNDVASSYTAMDDYKKAITQNQLTMRSLLAAIESRKKDVAKRYIEFYVVVVLLFILIGTVGVLYFLERYNYGIIATGVVIVAIALFQLVKLIVSFVKKN